MGDLVRKCLDRNMHTRISASEILEHPFIKRYAHRELSELAVEESNGKRNIEVNNKSVATSSPSPPSKKQQVSESPVPVVSRVKASDTIDNEDMKLLHELTSRKLRIGGGGGGASEFSLPVPSQSEILLEENGDSGFAPDS